MDIFECLDTFQNLSNPISAYLWFLWHFEFNNFNIKITIFEFKNYRERFFQPKNGHFDKKILIDQKWRVLKFS